MGCDGIFWQQVSLMNPPSSQTIKVSSIPGRRSGEPFLPPSDPFGPAPGAAPGGKPLLPLLGKALNLVGLLAIAQAPPPPDLRPG